SLELFRPVIRTASCCTDIPYLFLYLQLYLHVALSFQSLRAFLSGPESHGRFISVIHPRPHLHSAPGLGVGETRRGEAVLARVPPTPSPWPSDGGLASLFPASTALDPQIPLPFSCIYFGVAACRPLTWR